MSKLKTVMDCHFLSVVVGSGRREFGLGAFKYDLYLAPGRLFCHLRIGREKAR